MSEIETGKNSSPLVLMEGILEKLKGREFPWIFSGKKFSTTWVLHYYVLRHGDIPGQEAFLLEQHEDCMPFSKVHKTLDLRRVLQIDTNISLKVGNQNWILAIHYKAKHGGRLKVLYLAAHSETEMNMWVMKLGYAHKQDKDRQLVPASKEDVVSANKFSPIADCINSRSFTDNSMVELPTLSNITNNANYVDSVTTHAYIRLKDCSSTHSLGSSSASLSSSVASSSTLSENLSFKNTFLIPPPIPPKPSHGLRMQKGGKHLLESGSRYVLDQPLTPVDVHEILSVKEEEWSNETVRPDTVGSIDADGTFLSFDSSLTSTVSNSSAPKPLPRRRNFRNIPPEIDRSCKPTGIRHIAINTGQERSTADDWKREAFAVSSRFLPTNPLHQQSLHPVALRNKQIPFGQEALYDNESMRTTNGILDYLDPVREPLSQSQLFIKSSQRPKISCATEYTQIDEESTKAVLEANVRQDEMRCNGFPV